MEPISVTLHGKARRAMVLRAGAYIIELEDQLVIWMGGKLFARPNTVKDLVALDRTINVEHYIDCAKFLSGQQVLKRA